MTRKLEGLRIVVPESREIDLFVALLETEGAIATRCPLVQILEVDDFTETDAWIRRLVGGTFDDVVLFTGEGLRRLAARADILGLARDFATALGRARTIVRGPKPARALRELGLAASLSAPQPTSQGLIDALASDDLSGRRMGVQLYPGHGGDGFVDALKNKGAMVATVTPYRYASQTETAAVAQVIRRMAAGAFDTIAFTSSPQVERLADVAREHDIVDALAEGLKRTRVAAIGPVVEDALKRHGVANVIAPRTSFHLKPLVRAIIEARITG